MFRFAAKYLLGFILLTFPGFRLGAVEGPYHLAVRTAGEGPSRTLSIGDFRLLIDDSEKALSSAEIKRKSLALATDLGREFVLSFNLLQYGEAVERELSHFVTEVVQTTDTLYLLTPKQLYRLNVTVSKGSLQRKIRELLEKDCKVFRDEWKSAEAGLRSNLDGLIRVLDEDTPEGVEIYKKANTLLNSFPEEFDRYRSRFLLPDPNRYDQVLQQLGFGEGQRWWIHFEQYPNPDLYERIQRMIKGINEHLSYLGSTAQNLAIAMNSSVVQLEKTLYLPDAFPSKDLVGVMAARDVTFNVVFIRGDSLKDSSAIQSPSLYMTKLFHDAAAASGGTSGNAGLDTAEIAEIVNHVDVYYDLAFAWEGPAETARIRILAGGSSDNLRYAETLSRTQYDARMKLFSPDKVRIEDVSAAAGKISFIIKAFQRAKESDFGLIKIRIELLNGWNQIIFRDENTIRATKEAVSVSIPVPGDLKGASRLSITACDMIANRETVAVKPFEF